MTSSARRAFLALSTLVVMSAASACGGSDAAIVGKTHITRAVFERELAAIGANDEYLSRLQQRAGFPVRDVKGKFVPAFLAQVLSNDVRAAAASQLEQQHHYELSESERADARIDAIGRVGNPKVFDVFPRRYRDELVDRSVTVFSLRRALAGRTAERYYSEAKTAFERACEWDIVAGSRAAALRARQRIEAGESFQSVAREVSLDKGSGPKGGDIGCNERNNLVPQLDELAFKLPIGQVSDPVGEGEFFHLLLVTSRQTPPFAEIRGEVNAALDALGASRFQSALRAQLIGADVHVAGEYGVWDKTALAVVPPASPSGATPSPRPRPLPQVPTSSSQMDPQFQVGQNVFITDHGFRPRELVSIVQERISWTNETDTLQTVRFVSGGMRIGPIPPGGSASYTPDATISIAYTLADDDDVGGTIQVQPYFEPGEDPGAPNRVDADTPIPGTPSPYPTR